MLEAFLLGCTCTQLPGERAVLSRGFEQAPVPITKAYYETADPVRIKLEINFKVHNQAIINLIESPVGKHRVLLDPAMFQELDHPVITYTGDTQPPVVVLQFKYGKPRVCFTNDDGRDMLSVSFNRAGYSKRRTTFVDCEPVDVVLPLEIRGTQEIPGTQY